ncbi:MAG TPA: hypothetical protein VH253_06740 [Phycisphaerae bacterium]|nr:hypothetical protein [Phycisphaerae bacterium]
MAVFFLVIISVGIVVGSGVYIAVMNKMWYDQQRRRADPGDQPPRE